MAYNQTNATFIVGIRRILIAPKGALAAAVSTTIGTGGSAVTSGTVPEGVLNLTLRETATFVIEPKNQQKDYRNRDMVGKHNVKITIPNYNLNRADYFGWLLVYSQIGAVDCEVVGGKWLDGATPAVEHNDGVFQFYDRTAMTGANAGTDRSLGIEFEYSRDEKINKCTLTLSATFDEQTIKSLLTEATVKIPFTSDWTNVSTQIPLDSYPIDTQFDNSGLDRVRIVYKNSNGTLHDPEYLPVSDFKTFNLKFTTVGEADSMDRFVTRAIGVTLNFTSKRSRIADMTTAMDGRRMYSEITIFGGNVHKFDAGVITAKQTLNINDDKREIMYVFEGDVPVNCIREYTETITINGTNPTYKGFEYTL